MNLLISEIVGALELVQVPIKMAPNVTHKCKSKFYYKIVNEFNIGDILTQRKFPPKILLLSFY